MQIQDKAVLVKLSISLPGNVRKDKQLTDEVKAKHSMGKDAGRWLKQLYPEAALEPLTKLAGEIRTFHYENSLPWSDDGSRILPTLNHFAYTDKMRGFRQKFESLFTSHFIGRYEEWVAWAREAHNGTFDAANYVNPEKLKGSVTIDFQPIPSGADFRVKLSNDELSAMQSQVDERVSNAAKEATRDLWRRLIEPVSAMVERLSKSDATFRDTLIGNIKAIVALLPSLNLTQDADLEKFRNEIETELSVWNPEILRTSGTTRKAVADKAAEILARMSGYMA